MTLLDAPSLAPAARLEAGDQALAALLRLLKAREYRFVTPTPASHARILARPAYREAGDVRGVLGWSLPFDPALLDGELLKTLLAADAIEPLGDGRMRSRYRVSSLGRDLFLHSAYPTESEDAVFFGPDSYRFAELIRQELRHCPRRPGAQLVDIGAGAGVGAIVAARRCAGLHITMTDINPAALRLARINADGAGVEASYALGANLDTVEGPIDIALANPPYIIDSAGRDYRDGGDMHGARAAYDMARAATVRLAPQGRLILYTGSAIIDGEDPLRDALERLVKECDCALRYREIDPDVFGEELARPEYADVERIALIGAVVTRQG
jgi:methylase of polypeptide subunit release factors